MKDGTRSYNVNIYTYVEKKQSIWGHYYFNIKQDVPYIKDPYFDNAYISNNYLRSMAKLEKNRILKLLTDGTTN